MARLLFVLLACVCSHYAYSQLSLDSCQAQARRNYPMIHQYELLDQSKEFTLKNANKNYLPQLSITAIGGLVFGDSPGSNGDLKLIGLAQLNQTIWDGGATKAHKNIIEASSELEKANLENSLYEIQKRVNELYFGILLIDEQMAQLEQREVILNNNKKRIEQLAENGMAFTIDLDEIKVEQLKLNQRRKELQYTSKGFRVMLSLLTANEINKDVVLSQPDADLLITSNINQRPELSMFEKQRSLINAKAGIQRSSMMPKVGLLGAGLLLNPGLNLGPLSISSLGVVGLSASWQLNGVYKNGSTKELSELSLLQVDLQEETFRFNTNLQQTQIEANIDKQQAIIADDEEIVTLQQSIREAYQLKYDNGMCSLIDLLDATERESEANINKALHEMQLLITIYDYKLTSGN